MHKGINRLRFVVVLAVVTVYYSTGDLSGVSASRSDWCDDEQICNDTVECSTECVNRDVFPQEFITCGDFYGGWEDSYCENECGSPNSCSDYESPENCPTDCGEPGDGVCQTAYENYSTGDGDCGSCGDGTCQPSHETCGGCADCGSNCQGGGTPGNSCGTNLLYNSDGYCCGSSSGTFPPDGDNLYVSCPYAWAGPHCGYSNACYGLCDSGEQCLQISGGQYRCVGGGSSCL